MNFPISRYTAAALALALAAGLLIRLEASLAREAEAARPSDSGLQGRLDDIAGALAAQSRSLDELALRVAALARSSFSAAVPTPDTAAEKALDKHADDGSAAGDLAAARAFAAGREAFFALHYERAAALFAQACQLQPGDRDAGRWEAACRFYANPTDSSAYARLEALFRSALAEDPADTLALGLLARLCMERGEWSRAAEYFRRLVEAGPADAQTLAEAKQVSAWASP